MLKRAKRTGGDSIAPCHNALASRGCPNPDYATVIRRKPSQAAVKRANKVIASASRKQEINDHAAKVAALEADMLKAQAAVRAARIIGQPTAELAAIARAKRAELLAITDGTERRIIDVDTGSAVNPMVAV